MYPPLLGIGQLFAAPEFPEIEVLGPAPAPVLKVNNRYRYRCTLVGKNDKAARERISWLLKVPCSVLPVTPLLIMR